MLHFPTIIPRLINFGEEEHKFTWTVFCDSIIGGTSHGQITFYDNHLSFNGEITNINNTGFCCLRLEKMALQLTNLKEIQLTVKTDARPYVYEIEYNQGWHEEKLGQMFTSTPEVWQTVILPIENFKVMKFKKIIDQKCDFRVLNHIFRFGIHVAEKIKGPFKFEISGIKFIYN